MSKVPITGQPAITFAEACDRGLVREENQDSVLRATIPLGHLLIVADGIGGYQGGAVASRMVVNEFHQYLAALPPDYPVDQAIAEAASRTNASVIAAASAPDSQYQHMGSTVVMALLQQHPTGPRAWIGHIGDSRAYLVRGGRLNRITNDHSAVQALLNRNLITPEQALNHPDASVLTRSIGHQAQVEPDMEIVHLQPNDRILLCSDGLWGYVSEQEFERIAVDSSLEPASMAKALVDLALAAGGHDNIGIELAFILDPASKTARKLAPVKTRRRLHPLQFLALCIFAFGVLAGLISFAYLHHWFLGSNPPQAAPTQASPDQAAPTSPDSQPPFLRPGSTPKPGKKDTHPAAVIPTPSPTNSGSAKPNPANSGPADSGPAKSNPANSGPADSPSSQLPVPPAPVKPAPQTPASDNPALPRQTHDQPESKDSTPNEKGPK
jgi:serine/threonine protein phosphatase PrpC